MKAQQGGNVKGGIGPSVGDFTDFPGYHVSFRLRVRLYNHIQWIGLSGG